MAAEKDIPVLVSAIRGGADFLITGDKKHFGKIKLPAPFALKIVSPSEFVDLLLPEIIKTAPSLEKKNPKLPPFRGKGSIGDIVGDIA